MLINAVFFLFVSGGHLILKCYNLWRKCTKEKHNFNQENLLVLRTSQNISPFQHLPRLLGICYSVPLGYCWGRSCKVERTQNIAHPNSREQERNIHMHTKCHIQPDYWCADFLRVSFVNKTSTKALLQES